MSRTYVLSSAKEVTTYFDRLFAGEIDEARDLLGRLKFVGDKGERTRRHYYAQLLMELGEHKEAALVLEDALTRFGPYIGVTMDLATCHYMACSFKLYRKRLDEVHALVLDESLPLEPSRRVRYGVMVANHLEDLGEICDSLWLLERLENQWMDGLDLESAIGILVQSLRARSLFDPNRSLSRAYQAVLRAGERLTNSRLSVERDQALILAELQMFGPHHAAPRLEALLGRKDATAREKDFALADYLYVSRIMGHSVPDLNEPRTAQDAFEELVFRDHFKEPITIKLIQAYSDRLSWAAQLRLSLMAARSTQESERREIISRLRLLCLDVSPASRSKWMELFDSMGLRSEDGVTVSLTERGVVIDGLLVKTGPKETVSKLLRLFENSLTLSTDDVCEAVWGGYDENALARLKMLTKRLNTELLNEKGYPRFFRTTKASISIDQPLRLILSEHKGVAV